MRLLFLNHNIAWSGTFFRAYHLGRALVERGHEVTVVTTHPKNRLRFEAKRDNGVELILAPDLLWGGARQGWGPVNTIRRIGRLLGRRFDLIHGFDSRPAVVLPALAARRASGALLVMDWADWWGRGGTIRQRSSWPVRALFGPIETWFEEAFRLRPDGTTVVSRALGERARALGVPADRILCFPHGCDPARLRPMERAEARWRLGLPADQPLLVHLGVLTREDADLLFTCVRIARRTLPGLRLALIGNPRVGAPPDLAAGGVVLRAGFVTYDQLAAWLGATDLCVAPLTDTVANRGRWPSKINDYFAAGRPTLVTRVGDAATLVEERSAGFVSAADPAALAQALIGALGSEPALRAAGQNARRLAEAELAWPRLALRVEQFYGTLSARRKIAKPLRSQRLFFTRR